MGRRDAELTVVSICAACIQATESGNSRRVMEVHEAVHNSGELSVLSSISLSYCSGQIPLVRDCPLVSYPPKIGHGRKL